MVQLAREPEVGGEHGDIVHEGEYIRRLRRRRVGVDSPPSALTASGQSGSEVVGSVSHLRQSNFPLPCPEIRLANRRHCRVNPRPRPRQQPSILGQTSDENRQPPSRLRSRRAHDAVEAKSVRVQYRVTSAVGASLL